MILLELTEQEANVLRGLLPRLADAFTGSGLSARVPVPAQVANHTKTPAKKKDALRAKCTEELVRQLGQGFKAFVN